MRGLNRSEWFEEMPITEEHFILFLVEFQQIFEIIKDHCSNIWELSCFEIAHSKFQEKYGIVKIQSRIISSDLNLRNNGENKQSDIAGSLLLGEEYIDLDLILDQQSAPATTSRLQADFFSGELHIVYNPVYCLPAMYLSLFDSHGQYVCSEPLIRSILSLLTRQSTKILTTSDNDVHTAKDYRAYDIGSLLLDVHPILSSRGYYWTVHLCELSKSFETLQCNSLSLSVTEDSTTTVVESTIYGDQFRNKRWLRSYLMIWLSFFGPSYGIFIEAKWFQTLTA